MVGEEHVEQLLVADLRRIVLDLNDLGVPWCGDGLAGGAVRRSCPAPKL